MVELVVRKSTELDVLGICIFAGLIVFTLLAILAAYFKTQVSPAAFDNPLFGAIRLAAAKGDIKSLQMLSFAPRFDINAQLLNFTALHAAACGGQRDAALWLLQRGADVHAMKDDGWNSTALHYAAAHGSLGVCEVLLAYGADIDAFDSFGFNPEMLARKRHHTEVADYLAEKMINTTGWPVPEKLQGYEALLAPPVTGPWYNKFQNGKFNISVDLERGDMPPTGQALLKLEEEAWRAVAARGRDGIGTEGTVPKEGLKVFRILAICMQIADFGYLFYRAGWTFVPGKVYPYSVMIFLMEYICFAFTFVFILSMWNQIERPQRWMSDMMPTEELPHVDIYIVQYNEPIDLLEPTVVAALNINWPGDKLTVHILDDSQGKDVLRMVKRLRFQLSCMQRKARLVAMTRKKIPGVPHHAKAGNITHAILNSQGKGEFILVLDMDMIAHPDILQRLLGHFYRKKKDGTGWERKPRTALIQTPQDFYNVPPGDTFVHSARFFYGPMMQGRDGIDCSPCCGTGAVFTRESLVSTGGQSFGSITEDYNTSRTLFACGFSTMFLNERLSFGLAPDYIAEVFAQRQRWAMGALQMLFNPNNYGQYGLTYAQNLIFFDFLTYHFLAIPTVVMYIIPFIFIVFQIPPIQIANIWAFCISFAVFFGFNRLMLWWAHSSKEMDESAEMWRGWQMWLWLAPSHIKAIMRVMLAEGPLKLIGRCFGMKPITFVVTDKATGPGAGRLGGTDGTGARKKKKKEGDKDSALDLFLRNLRATWYFLVFYATFIGTFWYTIYRAVKNQITTWMGMVYAVNLLWWALAAWCLWPPIAALLPRVETETGWKIHWHAFLPRGKPVGSLEPLGAEPETPGQGLQRKPSMAARFVKAMSTRLSAFGSEKLSSDPVKAAAQLERQASRAASRAASQAADIASYSNIGRLAQPMRSAKSLAASALYTGAILPERDDHSFAASRQPSHVLVLPDGRLAPAPTGAISSARNSPQGSGGHSPNLSSGGGSPASLERRGSRFLAPSPFLNTQPSIEIKVVRAASLARKLEKLTGASSLSQVVLLPPGADLVAKNGEEEEIEKKVNKEESNDTIGYPSSESTAFEISLAVGDLPPPSKPSSSTPKLGDTIQEGDEEEEIEKEQQVVQNNPPELSFIFPPAAPKQLKVKKGVSFKIPGGGQKDLDDEGEDGSTPTSHKSPTTSPTETTKVKPKKGVSFKLPGGGHEDLDGDSEEGALSTPPTSPKSPTSPTGKKKKGVSFRLAPGADKGEDDYSKQQEDNRSLPEISISPLSRTTSLPRKSFFSRSSSSTKPLPDIDKTATPNESVETSSLPRKSSWFFFPSLPSIKTSSNIDRIADEIVDGIKAQEEEDEDVLRSLSPFAAEASTPFTFENTGAGEQQQESIVAFPAPAGVAHPGHRTRSNVHNTMSPQRSKSVKPLQTASSRRVTSLSLAEQRARAASRYLLDWTPSIAGDGGASVLLSGGSMMVPIVPTTIFESSIAAKPSFEDRKKPKHDYSFMIASVAIELGMLIVGIVSSLVPHPLPT